MLCRRLRLVQPLRLRLALSLRPVAPVETLPINHSRKGKEKAVEMEVDAKTDGDTPATERVNGRRSADGEEEGFVHGRRRRRSLAASSFTRSPFVVPPIPRLATSTVPPLAPLPVPPAAAPPDFSPSTRFAQLTLWSPHPGPPQHGSS
ncbi:hypothetical protein C8R45DRAFT_634121 [Mycena sanguinolenta]|nr:hypothetical protein C8R45DRAFT_634121 [Mycena sanguinolenta]